MDNYDKAKAKDDLMEAWANQLKPHEWAFIQKQQQMGQEADEIDQGHALMEDLDLQQIQDLFEEVRAKDN
jgi:hypothetical protein